MVRNGLSRYRHHPRRHFEIKARQPNEVTAAAIKELMQGKGQKADSVDAMLNELTESKVQNA